MRLEERKVFEKVIFYIEKNITGISCSPWFTSYWSITRKLFRMFICQDSVKEI